MNAQGDTKLLTYSDCTSNLHAKAGETSQMSAIYDDPTLK